MTTFWTNAARFLLAAASLWLTSDCWAAATFTTGFQSGNIQNNSLTEASGIVASRVNPNVLWSHNDSASPEQPYLFPMTSAGTNLGRYTLTGAGNIDWEDIAVGPGPVAATQYLYVADIGDNGASRSSISIYRVPEPVVSDVQSPVNTNVAGAVKLTFAYPGGPRDAESMFVDPLTRDIYIITKRDPEVKSVFRAAYPQATSGTTTLQLMTTFTSSTWLTSADISPDGKEILVRSGESTSGRLFTRPAGGSVTDAFNAGSISVPLAAETQGEAIGFDPTGRGYFTTSEGSNQPIFYFNRNPPPGTPTYWDNDGVAAGSYLATGTGMGGSGTWDTSAAKWYNGSADIRWLAGNDAVFWGTAGTVSLSNTQTANSLTFKTNGYTLTAGALNLTGPSVTVDAGIAATISTGIKGSVGLAKNGAGTLQITTAATYTGGTQVTSGKLIVTNASGSATGTGAVVIGADGTLGGNGTAQGDVTNNGIVTPGNTVGTLHIGGTYSQSSGGRLELQLASVASHDELAVVGSSSLSGTLVVSLSGGFIPHFNDPFELMTTAGFGGTMFTTTELPALASDLAWSLDYGANSLTLLVTLAGDFDHSGIVDSGDFIWWRQFDGSQAGYDLWRSHFGAMAPAGAAGSAAVAAVPEPAAYSAISFCTILAYLVWPRAGRRRVYASRSTR